MSAFLKMTPSIAKNGQKWLKMVKMQIIHPSSSSMALCDDKNPSLGVSTNLARWHYIHRFIAHTMLKLLVKKSEKNKLKVVGQQ